MNFFGFILILIILFMVRGTIRRHLKKKKLEMKPLGYRKYNPLVTLTEVVHYEVMPAFGLATPIVRTNIHYVIEEMLKGNETKIISVDDLPILYASAIPTSYQHYEIFRLFFEDLTKRKLVAKDTSNNIFKAIEFGV